MYGYKIVDISKMVMGDASDVMGKFNLTYLCVQTHRDESSVLTPFHRHMERFLTADFHGVAVLMLLFSVFLFQLGG